MTTPADEPGDRRPPRAPQPGERPLLERPLLERPPSDRYAPRTPAGGTEAGRLDAILVPVALMIGGAIAFVIAGGILTVTAGLAVVAAFLGWLTGRLVSPPIRAAFVAFVVVIGGFLGIWLFGRIEGGVLDPITYLLEVEGPIVVVVSLVFGGGLAAAASR